MGRSNRQNSLSLDFSSRYMLINLILNATSKPQLVYHDIVKDFVFFFYYLWHLFCLLLFLCFVDFLVHLLLDSVIEFLYFSVVFFLTFHGVDGSRRCVFDFGFLYLVGFCYDSTLFLLSYSLRRRTFTIYF